MTSIFNLFGRDLCKVQYSNNAYETNNSKCMTAYEEKNQIYNQYLNECYYR